MTLTNAILGRKNKRKGSAAEAHAREYLRYLGIVGIREVKTGMRKFGGRWMHSGTVEGDIRGMIPGSGRAVLAEVKYRPKVLIWSDLEDHQSRTLTTHAEDGGLALLCWMSEQGLVVMRWTPIGFDGPRCSLTYDAAKAQAITTPRFWLPELPAGMRA